MFAVGGRREGLPPIAPATRPTHPLGAEQPRLRWLTTDVPGHTARPDRSRPDNVLAHRWAPGDVVLWDNACVLHRADHSAPVGDRVMHRGMVASHVA